MNAVNQFCKSYYNEIPEHSLRSISLSAIGSFITGVIILTSKSKGQQVDFSRAIAGAGIAVIAATIQAVTIPIFNYAFNNSGDGHSYNPYQDFAHIFCNLAITEILINQAMGTTINLTSTQLSDLHKEGFYAAVPNTVIKSAVGMTYGLFSKIFNPLPELLVSLFNKVFEQTGFDYERQTTPVYFVI